MKKILVTGATGQIGSELTIALRNSYGAENVLAAGHKRPALNELTQSGPFCRLDVRDAPALNQVVEDHNMRYDFSSRLLAFRCCGRKTAAGLGCQYERFD